MSFFSRSIASIAQTIVPAVRRAASTAAPAATQTAKEGFKLVEVCVYAVYLIQAIWLL